MQNAGLVPDRSGNEILAHPDFPHARLGYVDAILALYEANPSLVELMRDAGRIMIYGVIMCLWGASRENDRSTWSSVRRIKSELAPFAVASDRQIDYLISRLLDLGYISISSPPEDARLRLVQPTALMIEHDQLWLQAHYVPLAHLYGAERYASALALKENGDFHRVLRAGSLPLLPHIARDVMRQNTPMMRILTRAVGILTLMKLVQMLARRDVANLTSTDLGSLFGVSRTHIRTVFAKAEVHGDAIIEAPGKVRPTSSLLRSFDKLIADGMAVSDHAYNDALAAYQPSRSVVSRLKGG